MAATGSGKKKPSPRKTPEKKAGFVWLVGAGPGDPGLLTLKAKQVLEEADVVFYDRLVNPAILGHAHPAARLIDVGKAPKKHKATQEDINALLVREGQRGKKVVRLKGGDPYIFGRGGEEALALIAAGVPFAEVPGITSAVAAPAYGGVPVTHRNVATSLTIVTAHEMPGKETTQLNWRALASLCATGGTLVFLMGVERLEQVCAMLQKHGLKAATPAALVYRGTWPEQRSLRATVDTLAKRAREENFRPPSVTVIGPVAGLPESLNWFEHRPLFGKTVVITRAREQASVLGQKLAALGATVVELPSIQIRFREDDLFRSLKPAAFDHLLFTSANGVKAVVENLRRHGRDIRTLAGPDIGAIGPATAAACQAVGLRVNEMPDTFVAESLLALYPPKKAKGKSFLLLRAQEARDVLVTGLRSRGATVKEVAVYDTLPAAPDKTALATLREHGADAVTFTASSTVRHFHDMARRLKLMGVLKTAAFISIGPITSATMQELGLPLSGEATESTMEGVVQAVVAALGGKRK